ncbi:MAG TPA: hypothetical protein VJ775_06065 [Sphingomicrobium sp.]|nr:hypothetical protein [Sphingomicrobium sp.]
MTSHTPGPWFWVVDDSERPTTLRRSGSGDVVIDAQSEQSNYGLSTHEWCDVSEADARLIVAAPEMLEALKLAEDVLSRFPFSAEIWPNGSHPNAGIQQIRDAIAKAEGR